MPVLVRPSVALLALGFAALAPNAHALSKRDQAAVEGLDQRMQAAEARYREGIVKIGNADPSGRTEVDAALEDMEDVMAACVKQKGCSATTMLTAYKRLLKQNADLASGDEVPRRQRRRRRRQHRRRRARGRARRGAAQRRRPALRQDGAVQPGRAGRHPPLADRHAPGADRQPRELPVHAPADVAAVRARRPARGAAVRRHGQGIQRPRALDLARGRGRARCSSCTAPAGASAWATTAPVSTPATTRAPRRKRRRPISTNAWAQLNRSIELSLAAYNGGEGRALRVYNGSGGRNFWDESVYNQFPAETRDYVPMVIAAAWLFLHPKEYGLSFPKVDARPAPLRLAQAQLDLRADHLPGQRRHARRLHARAAQPQPALRGRSLPAGRHHAQRDHQDRRPVQPLLRAGPARRPGAHAGDERCQLGDRAHRAGDAGAGRRGVRGRECRHRFGRRGGRSARRAEAKPSRSRRRTRSSAARR